MLELTVELPTVSAEVLRFTLAPTLINVAMFAVAGNLAVARVPVVKLEALDVNVAALAYAVAALVSA